MHEFSVNKDLEKKINNDRRRREVGGRKVATYLCPTSVEQDRVVTTLNIIKH